MQHARSQNTMAVVAMTRPFAFEGARRAHAADQLLADLSISADVVHFFLASFPLVERS